MKKDKIIIYVSLFLIVSAILVCILLPKNKYEAVLHEIGGNGITSYVLSEEEIHEEYYDKVIYYAFSGIDEAEIYNMRYRNPRWRDLTETDSINCVLYGGMLGDCERQSIVHNCIPNVSSGFYYFHDKQNRKNNYFQEDIISLYEEYSHRITIAVWDSENKKLYYVKVNFQR